MYCNIIDSIGTGGFIVVNSLVSIISLGAAWITLRHTLKKDTDARFKEKADIAYVDKELENIKENMTNCKFDHKDNDFKVREDLQHALEPIYTLFHSLDKKLDLILETKLQQRK
jgi:hypothetical protein